MCGVQRDFMLGFNCRQKLGFYVGDLYAARGGLCWRSMGYTQRYDMSPFQGWRCSGIFG